MGVGMAASLLRAGHEVTVYNRTPSRADELVKKGAVAVSRISDACAGHAVITMLADDAAVERIVYGDQGVLGSLRKGAVHISSSTISVALCERLTADHAAAGQRFVAAPVFGRPDVAAAGELTVVAAGSQGTIADVTPFLDAIGRRTFVMSDQPKAANLVKLSGNFLIASHSEIILIDNRLPWKNVLPHVPTNGSIRHMEKGQILGHVIIDADVCAGIEQG